jgi:hypothetical protein
MRTYLALPATSAPFFAGAVPAQSGRQVPYLFAGPARERDRFARDP